MVRSEFLPSHNLSPTLMSSPEDRRQDTSPTRPEAGAEEGSRNLIEFVDSRAPDSRSTIQRHTAYYSAARRRRARSSLLRPAGHSRYLEWLRNPSSDNAQVTPSSSSTSSASASPSPLPLELRSGRIIRGGHMSQQTAPSSRSSEAETAVVLDPLTPLEESVLEYCMILLTMALTFECMLTSPLSPLHHLSTYPVHEKLRRCHDSPTQ